MKKFTLVAGPCIIENEDISFEIAQKLAELATLHPIDIIFKASYRKANRSSAGTFTGIGDDLALSILQAVKDRYHLPICTDVHETQEVPSVARMADIIQIPAMLCRQTELLMAAGKTGKTVLIKKGQFMSGEAMLRAAEKVFSTGNRKVWLCERGNTFGYNDLIVDMRNIAIMQSSGLKVLLDSTHANQRPNSTTGITEGTPQHTALLARAGIAAGADGLFIEVHPHPASSPSDASTLYALDNLDTLLTTVSAIYEVCNLR